MVSKAEISPQDHKMRHGPPASSGNKPAKQLRVYRASLVFLPFQSSICMTSWKFLQGQTSQPRYLGSHLASRARRGGTSYLELKKVRSPSMGGTTLAILPSKTFGE